MKVDFKEIFIYGSHKFSRKGSSALLWWKNVCMYVYKKWRTYEMKKLSVSYCWSQIQFRKDPGKRVIIFSIPLFHALKDIMVCDYLNNNITLIRTGPRIPVRSQGKSTASLSREGLRNSRVLTCERHLGEDRWIYHNLEDHNPKEFFQLL